MGKPFLSRHFLAEQAGCLATVPFAAAGAAEGGVATTHNLLALGSWCQDAQEDRLTLIDLAVPHSGDTVAGQPAMSRLASFQHGGRVSALEVADCGGGAVLVLAGSSDGSVARLQLQVPTQPGSVPAEIQLREEDFDGALLLPWAEPHARAVAALAANPERRELLSAGADGSLVLAPLRGDGASAGSSQLYACSGAVTFAAARWNGVHTAVTGSLQGLVHVWDTRQAGRPALQLRQPDAPGAAAAAPVPAITSLDVHPAQHFCCATGADDGGVAVWDLRAASSGADAGAPGGADSAAATCCAVGGGGADAAPAAVCGVRFEGVGGIGSGSQRVAYCTAGGAIGVLRDVAARSPPRVLFREPTAAVRALCLEPAGPCSQLFAATDQEGLVYMANAL